MVEFKQYTVDTNFFRYHAYNNGDTNLRRAAVHFWKTAKEEVEKGEAVILVPAEVKRELEVQSHILSDRENNKIQRLLANCQEISPSVSIKLEHHVRIMSAYLRANFRNALGDFSIAYGGVSDSRILYSAYYEDSILVTANVKDFMLYPFLFNQSEDRLYDLKQSQFVYIPEETYNLVWQDSGFQNMFLELSKLEVELEDTDD